MDKLVLSYLAGAMDSDGFFSIKKSTYGKRVKKDCYNATYHATMGLKQVHPDVPNLLKSTFGGHVRICKPQTQNSKELWSYAATNKKAGDACRLLLPYLLIKKEQAKAILELRESKDTKYSQHSYWFKKENPDWRKKEKITTVETAKMMRYKSPVQVTFAIKNGTLLAIPYDHSGEIKPKVYKDLVAIIANESLKSKDGRIRTMPEQLVSWRHGLWEKVKELNKIGINGTSPNHRTGCHKPK